MMAFISFDRVDDIVPAFLFCLLVYFYIRFYGDKK